MTQSTNITVSLTLVDGTQRKFIFEPPPNSDLRIAARIKDFMNQESVAFQLPDRLLMIPKSQIMSIEFTPPIDKKIDGVFSHAREL